MGNTLEIPDDPWRILGILEILGNHQDSSRSLESLKVQEINKRPTTSRPGTGLPVPPNDGGWGLGRLPGGQDTFGSQAFLLSGSQNPSTIHGKSMKMKLIKVN